MIELLASIGWGLLACGSIAHVWHHRQLRRLLAMHLDHERAPAALLTVVEVALTVAIAVSFLAEHPSLRWFALAGTAIALGFIVWIARLLITNSDLPCACSFSEAPTTIWSFGRSLCVALVGCFALLSSSGSAGALSSSERLGVLLVGWAVASAIFVLPEAVSWPKASRALLARVDAHVASTSTS